MRRRAFLATAGTVALAGCTASGGESDPAGINRVSLDIVPFDGDLEIVENVTVVEHDAGSVLFNSETALQIELADGVGVTEVQARWSEPDAILESDEHERRYLQFGPETRKATLEYAGNVERIVLEAAAVGGGVERALLEIDYAGDSE